MYDYSLPTVCMKHFIWFSPDWNMFFIYRILFSTFPHKLRSTRQREKFCTCQIGVKLGCSPLAVIFNILKRHLNGLTNANNQWYWYHWSQILCLMYFKSNYELLGRSYKIGKNVAKGEQLPKVNNDYMAVTHSSSDVTGGGGTSYCRREPESRLILSSYLGMNWFKVTYMNGWMAWNRLA